MPPYLLFVLFFLQPRDCAIKPGAKIDMVTSKGSCPKYVGLPESIGKFITL